MLCEEGTKGTEKRALWMAIDVILWGVKGWEHDGAGLEREREYLFTNGTHRAKPIVVSSCAVLLFHFAWRVYSAKIIVFLIFDKEQHGTPR